MKYKPEIEFVKMNPVSDDDDDDFDMDPHQSMIAMMDPRRQLDEVLREYNMWTMHTNFPLSKGICTILDETVPGIESLSWLTPYRVNISFGKLFKEDDVMVEIRRAITRYLNSLEVSSTQGLTKNIPQEFPRE